MAKPTLKIHSKEGKELEEIKAKKVEHQVYIKSQLIQNHKIANLYQFHLNPNGYDSSGTGIY